MKYSNFLSSMSCKIQYVYARVQLRNYLYLPTKFLVSGSIRMRESLKVKLNTYRYLAFLIPL